MLISEEKLRKLLLEGGYMKENDFDMTQKEAAGKTIDLQELIVEKGFIRDETLGRIVADEAGYDYLDLKKADIADITDEMLQHIPEVVAVAQKIVVFKEEEESFKVATCHPDNYPFFKVLEQKTGKKAEAYYSTPFDIQQALKRYKGDLMTEVKRLIRELEKSPTGAEENVVEFVDLIMEYAHSNLASDVHVEPLSEFAIVRFRIDGILHKVAEYPKKQLHERISSRIKILAKLRTDEKSAAQDGRFNYKTTGGSVDVRVSIMPATEGENIVMRLLIQRGKRFSMDELGLLDHDLKKLRAAVQKPYGMVLSVGPTGSGKTTTLYSVLQTLNEPEVNIMTIEDPVEYEIEGVQQTQVNHAKNITFPTGLRTIVRQDPDIVMVGEIRDGETVDMALNSAMTGHLVLSTMHANDAATTFPRFLEMGAEPFLVASSVNVAIAQRLVRQVCPDCKESYHLSEEQITTLKEEEEGLVSMIKEIAGEKEMKDITFYRGKGCKFCNETGYLSRTAIFEVLEVTEEIRNLIVQKESSEIIRRKAMEQGMSTMMQDGVAKALKGKTTLEEIRKVAKT
ncbi:MAG: type II/IV secretion system protein [Candidatus Pacebacteria bacterium]|nr:type II/IV secretion system protein [Candidatus Paceibacterota bacterium]